MKNKIGQVAGPKALITVLDFTKVSNALVQKELDLNKKGLTDLCLFYCSLNPVLKSKSLIFKALKSSIRLTIEQYKNNRENIEDIISEALFLLKKASIKYFEKNRDCNFEQFAIVHIREGIKGYRNKWNGFSSSDRNELIHSAIRAIKKQNCHSTERLTYEEAKHLAKHFNLCDIGGYKIIWDLENIHFEKQSEWKIINSSDSEKKIHVVDNIKMCGDTPTLGSSLSNFIKSYHNSPENISSGEIYKINEERKNKLDIFKNFEKIYCNSEIKKNIFKKRMFCQKEEEVKLKYLSNLFGISIQRISLIEKKLKEEFKNFYTVEKNKTEDIK